MPRQSFLLVAVTMLIIVSAVFAYRVYQDRPKASGVEIKMDANGVSLKAN